MGFLFPGIPLGDVVDLSLGDDQNATGDEDGAEA